MENVKTVDLVVIGGGSAGLAAAIAAKENGIDDILIIEKEPYLGGILQQCIHNGFGLQTFKEQLSGPEYAERYMDMAKKLGIPYVCNSYVTQLTPQKDVYYANDVDGFVHIKAKSIVNATGCIERTPGAICLEGKRVSGVLTAGQAQKYLNIEGYMVGKKVFILGSGDIGLIMARRMTLEGATVLGVAELMPYSNGLQRNIAQCLNDFNIPLYLSHTIKNVIGKDHVEKVVIAKVDEKMNYIEGTEMEFDVDTLILSVGLIPYNVLLDGIGTKMSSTKGAVVDDNYMTSIDGIFACGNALHVHDLVDFVSLESKQAGEGAARYLKGQINNEGKAVTTVANGNGVGYVVPQLYRFDNIDESITFKFRVRKPYKNVKVVVSVDGNVIKSVRKLTMLPAEMEMLTIKKSELVSGSKLEIKVEEN